MKKRIFLYPICLAGGVLCALPAIFGRLFVIAWLAPALMYLASFRLHETGRGGRYLPALFFSFGFYGTGYSFVFTLGIADGRISAVLLLTAAWAALSLIQAALSGLHLPISYLMSSGGRNRWVFAVSSASLYALLEILLAETRYAIPWMNMALTQVYSYPMIQVSSLFGSSAVSLLVMLVGCFSSIAFHRSGPAELRQAAGALAAVIFSLNVIVGYTLALLSSTGNGESVRVAAVGNGMSMHEKNVATVEDFGEKYASAAAGAVSSSAELLVFPETSIPFNIVGYPKAEQIFSGIAEGGSVTLIAGAYTQNPSGELCNALVQYSPDGERTGEYVKRHLVPLSEFSDEMLGDKISALLSPFGLAARRFARGDGGLLVSESANVGGIICFDSLFGDTVRDDVRDGAEILAVSANDAVLGDNFAGRIHLSHTVLRAVESRRYAVRASTGGTSAVIGPDGRLRAYGGPGDPEYGYESIAVATVEKSDRIPLFCRIGPYALPGALLIICGSFAAHGRMRERRR